MSRWNFPDKQVQQAIFDLASDLSFEVKDLVYTPNDKLHGIVRDSGSSDWKWVMTKPDSKVQVSISVLYPSYLTYISFANTDVELRVKVPTSFSFTEYLSKHLKDPKDVNRLNKIAVEKSWKDNWSVVLDIFKAHALTDMCEILNGNEWPNIEFNIEDYVDADALGRMYEDQLNMIEESKKVKSWLHIINFKKKI